MPDKQEPIPVGTIVNYHGSIGSYHGVYEVTEHHTMTELKTIRPDIAYRKGNEVDSYLAEKFTDGVSYDLWPVGVEKKYGNRGQALYGARRGSISLPVPADPADKFRGDIEL